MLSLRSLGFLAVVSAATLGAACSAELKVSPTADPPREGDPTTDADGGAGGEGGTSATTGKRPVATKDVRLVVEPGDDGASLIAAIKGAKKSVHMTMYLLSADNVISALLDRQKAGVDVKVVLNKSFPQAGTDQNAVFTKLQNAGVGVTWAKNTLNFTHAKTVILDGQEAWIMTMNATFSAFRDNREYLAVDTDPKHVAQAEALFTLDYDGKSTGSTGDLVVAPSTARPMLLALIDSAKDSVDVEVEAISDDEIVAALGRAVDRGCKVRVIVADNSDTPNEADAHAALQQKGIGFKRVTKPYIHAKAIVVDGETAFVGSENLTTNSLLSNREIGVIFDVASEVQKLASSIDADYAAGH